MDLAAVMDDIGDALDTLPGLRVFPYWADRVTPPAAIVAWPEEIVYDATMVRGADRVELPVTLLIGRPDARSSRDVLARYLDGSGTHSIKAAVEAFAATAYDSVRVMRAADFTWVIVAGVEYLSATLYLDVIGRGAQ